MKKYFFCLIGLTTYLHAQQVSYVDNNQCLPCHQSQAKLWEKSDHYYSMLPASKSSVLGDFNHGQFNDNYQSVLFYKKQDDYLIKVTPRDKKSTVYKIKYTFGYKPLQQYLISFPKGKLQAFNIAWDNIHKKWFNLTQGDDNLAQSPLHWTKRFYNWNHSCADCHSTNYQKKFDGQYYQSSFSGVNVNCQACHGPGSQHLTWAKSKQQGNNGLIINFSELTSKKKVEQCAHCHARRSQVSAKYSAVKSFDEQYIPALLRPELYYPDGQIKEEVFVYGSFLQSKMYQAGVQCTDCHQAHSLQLKYPGNQVCTQCHNDSPIKRFNGLKTKNYDSPAHSHHSKKSKANQCVSCHMPETTYMKIDPRRDHSFKVPNPELTIKYNIPNACNRCHNEKSASWAKEKILQWFGRLYQNSPVFTKNQRELIDLANNSQIPDIYRASALMLLRLNSKQAMDTVVNSLQSSSSMVKLSALNQLQQTPAKFRQQTLTPLLQDKNNIIRAQTASMLADTNMDKNQSNYQASIKDYQNMQHVNSDQPESHMNLAQLKIRQGNNKQAIEHLERAIKLAPQFIPAYQLLAQLYAKNNDNILTITTLQQGIQKNPDDPSLHYQLALAFVPLKKYQLAANELKETLKIDASFPRAVYNLSLIQLQLGQTRQALNLLERAHKKQPQNTDILNNLIIIHLQLKNNAKIKFYIKQLLLLQPNDQQARHLLHQLPN